MAIYGVGFRIDGENAIDEFFDRRMVGTGWSASDAADIHEIFKSLKTGDIIFLKSCSYSSDITVRGIGVIRDNSLLDNSFSGWIEIGRLVNWLSRREIWIERPGNTKNNTRGNTIYQEYHPDVTNIIMNEVNANYH